MKLDVALAPTLLEESPGHLCAAIDVLRATSTIIAALSSGAAEVRPCLEIEEARRGAAELGSGSSLTGGEDRGNHIPGFDLGNSPLEYMKRDVVGGKVIFHYTSNGTGTIRRANAACGGPVHIAALLNVSAVTTAMVRAASQGRADGILIVCSGRYGRPSAEDLHCAGLLVDRLRRGLSDAGRATELGDSATIAAVFAAGNAGRSLDVLAASDHGQFLKSAGFWDDLEFAARIDVFDAVPVFDGHRVTLSQGRGTHS